MLRLIIDDNQKTYSIEKDLVVLKTFQDNKKTITNNKYLIKYDGSSGEIIALQNDNTVTSFVILVQ